MGGDVEVFETTGKWKNGTDLGIGDLMDYTDCVVWLIAIIAIVSIVGAACVSLGSGADGTATDSIARISYGGWVWKTWRVELTNDHPVSDGSGGTVAQRYGVSAQDTELIKQLQVYQASGQKVKIYYRGNILVWNWDYSDAEVINRVEAVG